MWVVSRSFRHPLNAEPETPVGQDFQKGSARGSEKIKTRMFLKHALLTTPITRIQQSALGLPVIPQLELKSRQGAKTF